MNRLRIVSISILIFVFIPNLIFAHHTLNEETPSGDFVFLKLFDVPINFRLDPGTLGGGDGNTVVETSCDVWNNVPNTLQLCGDFSTLSEDVTVDNFSSIISAIDGNHDVVFDETGEIIDMLGLSSSNTIGISLLTRDAVTGEIIDVTLVLNGSLQSGAGADLLSTTIHEMGHGWGLAHTVVGGINTASITVGLEPIDPIRIPTMFPFNIPIDDAFGDTLEIDDEIGIAGMYPSN